MNFVMPLLAASVLYQAAQVPAIESADFSKERQVHAVTATVRIRNLTLNREGSGVLVGKSGPFVYVLTPQHLVQGGDRLEIATFSKESYPKPINLYRAAEITAELRGLEDLALVRIRTADAMPSFLRICPEKKVPKKVVLPVLSLGCENGEAPTPLLEKQVEKKIAQRPGSKELSSFWVIDSKYASGRSGGRSLIRRGVCSASAAAPTAIRRTLRISTKFTGS